MNIFDVSGFTSPIFIAKLVDFIVFVAAIVWVYNKWVAQALVAHQEAQNRAVEEAIAYRERCAAAVEEAARAVERARVDAARMVEIAQAQAAKLIADERVAAQDHAARMLAHAAGELERERYRVRRELLTDTVQRAHAQAQNIVRRELDDAAQRALLERFVDELEAARRV